MRRVSGECSLGGVGIAAWSLVALILLVVSHYAVTGTAKAAKDIAPFRIAVHVSSDKGPSAGPAETSAIRDHVQRRADLVNEAGGIGGHPLEITIYDDKTEPERTIANVERALADPDVIAMIGIWSSSRGAAVVDRIGRSGIPFISEMSVESLFEGYANVYSLTRSVRDEQEVFQAFVKDRFRRVAFVGDVDDLYTNDYLGHLERMNAGSLLVSSTRHKGNIEDQIEAVDQEIERIKAAEPDLIFLSIGSKRGAAFLRRATLAGIRVPVFIALGSVSGVMAEPGGLGYEGPLYEVAEGGIANLNNERLEQLLRRPGMRNPEQEYSAYALGYGARYADLVALVAEAAAMAEKSGDVAAAREAIATELAGLVEGRRIWRGWAQDWSFTRERASSERSLVVWRPAGQASAVLAPIQFIRLGSRIVAIPVLYVHLDMTRVHRVDSNEKSFDAEFFFTMRSARDVGIAAVEFTNAVRGPGGAQPVIGIREVHRDDGAGGEDVTRIYKVNGRFSFEPDLRKYPFDEQVFTISFQPASTSTAFFLQPPSERVRQSSFSVDGWRIKSHYVGANELIIRSVAGQLSEERIIPYYNFNYTWVMKRQVVDYMLRVIVPLSFIMMVAYLAIFIPRSEFEAIMAIQVTALLSAIALYLALSQPQADDATLSDIIFVMAYATISVMIALSIFEVNATLSSWPAFMRGVHVVQVYLVPVVALGLIAYVLFSASSNEPILDAVSRSWRRVAGLAVR